MRVYVAGNPDVALDSVQFRILKRLRKEFPDVEFAEIDPSDIIPEEEDLVIIDAAEGIGAVRTIEDMDLIESGKRFSLHDFDLGFGLKLMKKAGKLGRVRIICIPMNMEEAAAFDGVRKEIIKLSAHVS